MEEGDGSHSSLEGSLSILGPQVQLGDQPVRKAGHGGNWQQGLGGASQALCVLSSSSSLWSSGHPGSHEVLTHAVLTLPWALGGPIRAWVLLDPQEHPLTETVLMFS